MIIRNSVSANVAHRCLNAADVRLSDLEEAFGMKNGAHLPERSERLGAIREADLRSRAEADVDSGSARGGGRRGVGDGGAGSASRTVIQRCFHILATTLLTIATIIAPGSAEVLSSLFVEDAYSGEARVLIESAREVVHRAPRGSVESRTAAAILSRSMTNRQLEDRRVFDVARRGAAQGRIDFEVIRRYGQIRTSKIGRARMPLELVEKAVYFILDFTERVACRDERHLIACPAYW